MKALVIISAALIGFSCSRTVYLPKETVKVEYRDRVKFDSIFQRDSIFSRQSGDTILIYRDKYIHRDKFIRDTIVKVDSVSYPVVVEIEREVRYIPKFYRWCFGFSVVIAGVGIWRIARRIAKG